MSTSEILSIMSPKNSIFIENSSYEGIISIVSPFIEKEPL